MASLQASQRMTALESRRLPWGPEKLLRRQMQLESDDDLICYNFNIMVNLFVMVMIDKLD